jgi:hypothetical protein
MQQNQKKYVILDNRRKLLFLSVIGLIISPNIKIKTNEG